MPIRCEVHRARRVRPIRMSSLLGGWTAPSIAATVLAVTAWLLMLGGCTGPRPVLVEPIPEPTLDAAAYARSLPNAAKEPLEAMPVSSAGEPTAQDAIWVWSQTVDLPYEGTCSSVTEAIPNAICSVQVADSDVFQIGPDARETWWVLAIGGSEANYRVEAVYPAGSR